MAALELAFADKADTYVWFDLFSNNQHVAVDLNFDWWCNTFLTAIRKIGHTFIILTPWDNPIPFERAWCLFEFYCAVMTGAKLEVAMRDNEHQRFFTDMRRNPRASYNRMLGNINLERSECWNPDDQRRIFEAVESMDGGIAKLNKTVLGAMRDAVTSLLANHSASSSRQKELDMKLSHGSVLDCQGKNKEALVLYHECLEGFHSLHGKDSAEVATTYNNMAGVYNEQGEYNKALVYYEKSYHILKIRLGKDHASTKDVQKNIDIVHRKIT